MKLAFYIGFFIHTLVLFGLTGVAFMQAGDFKYFSKTNQIVSYFFVFFILLTYVGSLIALLTINF
ncbi:hypothetical protein HOG48_04855 [Candidatus Peregrinibacteria bacterium]|jgi:hypothetical protein|nr:hypothetical protein [Candidatus Peregrinibacteria bacterium]